MKQQSIKERDRSDCNIIIKSKNSIFPPKIEKEKANNSLINSNNSISQSTDQKQKQNNSLIKSKSSITQNIGLKEKPNNINSSSSENKNNKSKKKKILIISLSCLVVLLIIGIILMIGHFQYDWFKHKKELVIVTDKKVNSVQRYLEKKNAINYYEFNGVNETQEIQNYSIITDFIVAINKKERIDKRYDFSDIDYLHEAFLLIINITQLNDNESYFLGGIDIYDESKTIQKLIEKNNEIFSNISNSRENIFNIPFSKFYFYENGTLGQIYFPLGINEFYKSALIDLIEKVTPKLSKSLYDKKEENKRRLENGKEGIYFNYEEIKRNGIFNKATIYEEKLKKNFGGNQGGYVFEDNKINSKIVRTFNSSGEMNHLQMEGEALFTSRQPESKEDINLRFNEELNETGKFVNTNESYYNLGFNLFKMIVSSNMELILNELSPKVIQKLNILSNMINLEIFQASNNITEIKENKEINNTDNGLDTADYEKKINNNKTENEKRNLENDIINYPRSYKATYTLFSINFLGLIIINYRQELEINNKNGLRKNSLILRTGYNERTLDEVHEYQYYYTSSKYKQNNSCTEKNILELGFSIFGFGPKATLTLKSCAYNSIYIDIKNKQMITKGYTTHAFTLKADLKTDFIVRAYGAKISDQFIRGDTYIQIKSIANSSNSEVTFYRSLNFHSIQLEIYFSVWFIFWENKYSKTFYLFSGFGLYDKNIYYY